MTRQPILLIGDLIGDLHHYGEEGHVSSESLSSLGIHKESNLTWGGAGLVARNLLALGVPTIFITIVGDDTYGEELSSLSHKHLDKRFLKENGRKTIVKERFIIKGKKVLRWNRGDSHPIRKSTESAISKIVGTLLPTCERVVIADYRHGLMSEALARKIIAMAQKAGKEVWVDSQVLNRKPNYHWYGGVDLICFNQHEASSLYSQFDENKLEASLKQLRKKTEVNKIIVKLGSQGSASLLEEDYLFIKAHKVKALDTVGAGDAFLAALSSKRELGQESLSFASKWAALATTIMGTEPPKRSMLKK